MKKLFKTYRPLRVGDKVKVIGDHLNGKTGVIDIICSGTVFPVRVKLDGYEYSEDKLDRNPFNEMELEIIEEPSLISVVWVTVISILLLLGLFYFTAIYLNKRDSELKSLEPISDTISRIPNELN